MKCAISLRIILLVVDFYGLCEIWKPFQYKSQGKTYTAETDQFGRVKKVESSVIIKMKKESGREKDILDIKELTK